MKVCIIGASNEKSVGHKIKPLLEKQGHQVILASRSGRVGEVCDITDIHQLKDFVRKHSPDALIIGAGVWGNPKGLGEIKDWSSVEDHVLAKSLGAIMALDTAVHFKVKNVIFLGGSKVSSDPRFMQFTIGNAAIWAATQFATQHTNLNVYYLEQGGITGTTMTDTYIDIADSKTGQHVRENSVEPDAVATEIHNALSHKYPRGSRISVSKIDV